MFLLERIILYLFMFVGLPAVVFFFVRAIQRDKTEVERTRATKELREAEARADEARARLLAEENRKYDRLIAEEEARPSPPSAAGSSLPPGEGTDPRP
jgi:hypothetical protein